MPKNLTDVNSFETVTVPVGTDPATAGSVETPFQLLANRTRYLLDLIIASVFAVYLELFNADTSPISVFDLSGVKAGCISIMSAGTYVHTIIDNDGQTATCLHPGEATPGTYGGGGVLWEDEADTPTASLTWTAAGQHVDVCGSWVGGILRRCAVSSSATGQVAYSQSPGSWSAVAGGVAGTTWTACEFGYDGTEKWVIGGASGALATTTNIATTSFSSKTSGLVADVVRIRSNRKPNSGHRWLALDANGNLSVSDDSSGATWTVTLEINTGLTSAIHSIAWDAATDCWVGIEYNGYRAWSSDGKVWSESPGPELPGFTSHVDNEFMLDADDDGNLVLDVYLSGTRSRLYVAGKSGSTMPSSLNWIDAHHPGLYDRSEIAFMGHGKIVTVGSAGILYSGRALTTRWSA